MPKGKKGFQHGVSGNPGGRPTGYADFAARCRKFSDEKGFKILTGLARSTDARVQLDATKFLIERGYGKSTERIEVLENPLKNLTDKQLALIAAGKATPADFIN